MAAPSSGYLFAQVKARLDTLPGLFPGNVFDSQVPTTLPKDSAGFIRPYVVIFAGAVNDIFTERDLTQLADLSVSDFRFQTNCVGPTGSHARDLADAVRMSLTNLPMGAGFIKPDPDGFRTDVLPDNQVIPARFYMPLMWRLTTT
ncbi:tail terminator [Arthrobacter phage TripleJ]|uniref:Tail terminator n=1 Tax=Arthrobacter phage TripleJ TaxID=2599838 RepID=A0A5J6TFX5_9CAUD|nr:tail terminator [Arthrobacter phage TripleJ]QFG09555.1 tail terminator [Arthrobacter phage TripleJ]